MKKGVLPLFIIVMLGLAHVLGYEQGVTAKQDLKTTTTANGQKIEYLKTNMPEVTVLEVSFVPGAQTGWHLHPVPVYAYVLRGTLTVELEGGKTMEFGEGQAIIEAVNTPHNGVNKTNSPVMLVVFYTGAQDKPNIVMLDKH